MQSLYQLIKRFRYFKIYYTNRTACFQKRGMKLVYLNYHATKVLILYLQKKSINSYSG